MSLVSIKRQMKDKEMDNYKSWNDIGKEIRDAVEDALETGNFRDLGDVVVDTVTDTVKNVTSRVGQAVSGFTVENQTEKWESATRARKQAQEKQIQEQKMRETELAAKRAPFRKEGPMFVPGQMQKFLRQIQPLFLVAAHTYHTGKKSQRHGQNRKNHPPSASAADGNAQKDCGKHTHNTGADTAEHLVKHAGNLPHLAKRRPLGRKLPPGTSG